MRIPASPTLALLLAGLVHSGCGTVAEQREAHDGRLDLSRWDPGSDAPIALAGSWAFHWRRLVDPGDAAALRAPPAFVRVPGAWNGVEVGGARLGGVGYATYHLVVELPERHPALALELRGLATAYRLYADGELVAGAGVVSQTASDAVPASGPRVVGLPTRGRELSLVVHVSNFHYAKGGMGNALVLGESTGVRAQQETTLRFQSFIAGAMAIMALYHLSLFASRRSDRSSLWFAGVCLSMVLRVVSTDQRVAVMYLPGLSWEWSIHLEYASMFLIALFVAVFVTNLFPGEVGHLAFRVVTWLAACGVVFVLVTPALVYSRWLSLMQAYLAFGSIYCVAAALRALRRRREGGGVFALAFVILAATVFHDIGISLRWVDTPFFLLPVGIFLFTFLQAVVLSQRLSRSLVQVEEGTEELFRAHAALDAYSKDLEARVQDRTRELEEANRQLARLASADTLTRVGNRRALDEALERLWADHARRGATLSAVICDIDHFKEFNDAYGHLAGDEALLAVAQRLREAARRPLDVVARYGGEEFVMVLADSSLADAFAIAEGVRAAVAGLGIPHTRVGKGVLSVSVGVATVRPAGAASPRDLLSAADAALYRAKQEGRDRVVAADEP